MTAFSIDEAGTRPGPAWLQERRRGAAARFAQAGLPTVDEEVWRYSRINDLDLTTWRPTTADDVPSDPGPTAAALLDAADASLVIWTANGLVQRITGEIAGVTVSDVDAMDTDGPLGRVLGEQADGMTALHDAFAAPILIQVADGVDAGRILVVASAHGEGVAGFPRVVVETGQQSTAEVLEIQVSESDARTLSIPVTELIVGRDANLRHVSVQVLGDHAWQIARLASTIDAGATLRAGAAAFGGDYARLRVDTTLAGRGAHGEILAAYFGDGSQLLDFRTFQDHVAPDTTSNLLFKGALGQKGASVYTGLIKIRPEARGTQAFQTNRNLKLSDEAWTESVPNLEIENNEVQCSHASTVGPVDEEQRFYLESRGVPTARADRLIVRGFFEEVLEGLALGAHESIARDAIDTSLERSMA